MNFHRQPDDLTRQIMLGLQTEFTELCRISFWDSAWLSDSFRIILFILLILSLSR